MVGCSGYGCFDHFLEGDTTLHAWEVLAQILQSHEAQDILLDVGMYARARLSCRSQAEQFFTQAGGP